MSPLLRARQTAEPIAKAVGLEPIVAPWLRELGLPVMSGDRGIDATRAARADATARCALATCPVLATGAE